MAIAGDDWDDETGLVKGGDDGGDSFTCPASEGDYPAPGVCDVYYQCAQGKPYKHRCEAGLRWNTENNQCDWEHNVDCNKNNMYYSYY